MLWSIVTDVIISSHRIFTCKYFPIVKVYFQHYNVADSPTSFVYLLRNREPLKLALKPCSENLIRNKFRTWLETDWTFNWNRNFRISHEISSMVTSFPGHLFARRGRQKRVFKIRLGTRVNVWNYYLLHEKKSIFHENQ